MARGIEFKIWQSVLEDKKFFAHVIGHQDVGPPILWVSEGFETREKARDACKTMWEVMGHSKVTLVPYTKDSL